MNLVLKPDKQNSYPVAGVLVRGSSPAVWFRELQGMKLSLREVNLYPLPGTTANVLWGCFVELVDPQRKIEDIGRNEFCCCANELLFVPQFVSLYPRITVAETSALLKGKKHVLHPEIGLIELPEAVDAAALLREPQDNFLKVTAPQAPEFVPLRIKSFMVKPLPPKEVLKEMEKNLFPKTEPLNDKPLGAGEKLKLSLYKKLFTKSKNKETGKTEITQKPLFGMLRKMRGLFKGGADDSAWEQEMQQNFDELDQRSQEQMERLMNMLKENPEDALKYAVPIGDGTDRGPSGGSFELSQRWNNFGLFGGSGGSGGGSFTSERTNELAAEYHRIAQELIKKKDFRKAAFVYQKLLKQPHTAADTLEKGEIYPEAAAVFLEYAKNKDRAAQCYEKGNMTMDAIGLYKELNKNEKVGDLYVKINKRRDANIFYEKTADEYEGKKQYVKASLIYREKMLMAEKGQDMLLNGWRENSDAQNCMGIYFSNIESDKVRGEAYETFYKEEVDDDNRVQFIAVAAQEFRKRAVHAHRLKTMAYEAAVQEIPKNPGVVSALTDFNKNDKQFVSDTVRFRHGSGKKQ